MTAAATGSNCKSCGAPIYWVELESGKRMPLDPALNTSATDWPATTFGLIAVPIRGGLGHALRANDAIDTRIFRYHYSHFATCPNAAEHRKT
jgi:hypothetical protein